MKLLEILGSVKYELIQGDDIEISHITIDSRKKAENSLFACISGFNVDRHDYIFDAHKNGAVCLLIEKYLPKYPENTVVIKVNNCRDALSFMADNFYHNPSRSFNLIGVTGTNGKTSTTFFLDSILRENNHRTGIIGTVDTLVVGEKVKTQFETSTTPDSLELQQIFVEMKDKKIDDCVMEVSSHALLLNKVSGLNFHVSIFTNLTQDHLDLHGSMDEYKAAKGKLFAVTHHSVVNIDDPYAGYMLSCCREEFSTYSIDLPSNLQAKDIVYTNESVEFSLVIDGEKHVFYVPVPGRFTVYNALGVIGASLAMDIPIDCIQRGLKKIKGVPGRIQRVSNDLGIGVFVDYAHTPDGLENIITSVKEFTKGNVITIFGCGGDRDKTKRPMMGRIAAKNSDYAIITSDNPRSEDPESILKDVEVGVLEENAKFEKIIDRKEAIFHAINMAKPGDSVIITGKGHENYQIFADRTIDFDDFLIAEEALKGRRNM